MGKLIISNQRTEEMVGDLDLLDPKYRDYIGNQAMRIAWCLQAGDILVLPVEPPAGFLKYVTSNLGIDERSIQVLVPQAGSFGRGMLSRDRLLNSTFLQQLRAAVELTEIDTVMPFHFDSTITALVQEIDLTDSVPGFAFFDQRGSELVNSKSTFRAIAQGTAAALPDGRVETDQATAFKYIWSKISQGESVILKQDYHVAGFGNEVISPDPKVFPLGAKQMHVVNSREGLKDLLDNRWSWFTEEGRHKVVIEHYTPESAPIYAEYVVHDYGVDLTGHGEMRMMPVINGLIVPAPSRDLPGFDDFLKGGRNICETLRAMGYRGIVSVDAIVTPDKSILINEFNCRVGGSTHIHTLGQQVVGEDYFDTTVLMELRRCEFPPFESFLRLLESEELSYQRGGSGIVVTVADDSGHGESGEYCIIAKNMDEAEQIEKRLAGILQSVDQPAGA